MGISLSAEDIYEINQKLMYDVRERSLESIEFVKIEQAVHVKSLEDYYNKELAEALERKNPSINRLRELGV